MSNILMPFAYNVIKRQVTTPLLSELCIARYKGASGSFTRQFISISGEHEEGGTDRRRPLPTFNY